MLTPVTPNPIATSATIKSHGSESRTASGHNVADSQVILQTTSHSSGVGLDAGTILANVNAEAATAGNRTVLQTLALAVAAQLNLVRRQTETMETFFLRIAAALDDMAPDERDAVELKAGLKLLKIQLPELSAALKQPESALAARLSAMAEAPLATPQKTAAATATTTYLQEAPGVSRAAETLAMVTQSRSNAESNGIFSSAPTPAEPEQRPADARGLQAQLKSLFEPGVAETRVEIATKVEQPNVLILGGTDEAADSVAQPDMPASTSAESQQVDASEHTPAAAENQANDLPVNKQSEARPTDARQSGAEQTEARQTDVKQADAEQAGAGRTERPRDSNSRQSTVNQSAASQSEAMQVVSGEQGAGQTVIRQSELKPVESKLLQAGADEAATSALPETAATEPRDERVEPKRLGLPIPQNNNNYATANSLLRAIARELVREKVEENPTIVGRRDDGDHRMQTMLTLKGIAEVITAMPSKAAEFLMSPQLVADIKAKEAKGNRGPLPGDAAAQTDESGGLDKAEVSPQRDPATPRHASLPTLPRDDETDQTRMTAGRAGTAGQQPFVNAAEPEKVSVGKAANVTLDPVPFAFAALQPAKEEFKAESVEERGRHEDEGEDAEEQEQEDAEARRERLARKATDDLLRPEPEADPEVKITRDSSQADRAYALYQRMAGF